MLSKKLKDQMASITASDPTYAAKLIRMKTYFRVALQIAELRKNKGLTQTYLAKKLNTTQPNIARWETPGYDRYSLSRLLDIAEALDSTLDIRFVSKGSTIIEATWGNDLRMLQQIRHTQPRKLHYNNQVVTADFNQGQLFTANNIIIRKD